MAKYTDAFFPDKINDLVDNDGHLKVVPQMRRISDYLYELKYDNLDYKYALKYTKDYTFPIAACSEVRNGNWIGRNFDGYYNYDVEFIVRVPPSKNTYASIGIASSIPNLTLQNVEAGTYFDEYRTLPFYLTDGINEHGLYCGINVVPAQKGLTTGSITDEEPIITIPMTMIPRYVLDHYKTVDEVIEGFTKNVSVYANKILHAVGYEIHFMIADSNKTAIVEFVDNRAVVVENVAMTNFHLYDVNFNDDGTVETTETGKPTAHNNIETHGSGLERWNIIQGSYADADNKTGMVDLMHNKLDYRRSYSTFPGVASPYWYSEFVGINAKGEVVLDDTLDKFDYIVNESGRLFANRDRSQDKKGVWHTTHSSIYDLIRKKLYVYDSSEDGTEYSFTFKKYYTAEEIDAIIEEIINNK